MKIFNENKTQELTLEECNLEYGYLKTETEVIHHDAIDAVPEEGHYVTIREYDNGGKDVEWIVDVPSQEAQEAYDEFISYQIYIPYDKKYIEKVKINKEIKEYKQFLLDSDYKAIKYAEGYYTEEEYEPIRDLRQSYRNKINELEKDLYILEEGDYSV